MIFKQLKIEWKINEQLKHLLLILIGLNNAAFGTVLWLWLRVPLANREAADCFMTQLGKFNFRIDTTQKKCSLLMKLVFSDRKESFDEFIVATQRN